MIYFEQKKNKGLVDAPRNLNYVDIPLASSSYPYKIQYKQTKNRS